MSTRRMALVPQQDLDELMKLASAAVKLHENVTHYGRCDVCDLAHKWRRCRDDSLDVNGIGEWHSLRQGVAAEGNREDCAVAEADYQEDFGSDI